MPVVILCIDYSFIDAVGVLVLKYQFITVIEQTLNDEGGFRR